MWKPVPKILGSPDASKARAGPEEEIGQLQQAGRPVLSPSHGTRAPTALCLSLPVTQDSRKKFSCVWRIPWPTQDHALLSHPSWLPQWLTVSLAGACCLCPGEDASSSWQPSLAKPTGPETLPKQAVPSNLPVRVAMRPLLQGQLSPGWLPRGPTCAGNCGTELRGAQGFPVVPLQCSPCPLYWPWGT